MGSYSHVKRGGEIEGGERGGIDRGPFFCISLPPAWVEESERHCLYLYKHEGAVSHSSSRRE
jgi:hypothetical protein